MNRPDELGRVAPKQSISGLEPVEQPRKSLVRPEQQQVSSNWEGHTATLLCDKPRQSFVKDLTISVYQDLLESAQESIAASDPQILEAKKTSLKTILSTELEKLNSKERSWITTAKRAGLVFLSLFVITIPLTHMLYSDIARQHKLKTDLLMKVLSKTVDQFDAENNLEPLVKKLEVLTELKKESLPIEPRRTESVRETLTFNRSESPKIKKYNIGSLLKKGNADSLQGYNPPVQVGKLTLARDVMVDLNRNDIHAISIEGHSVFAQAEEPEKPIHKALGENNAETNKSSITLIAEELLSQMKGAEYGDENEKKNILNNLFAGFNQSRFTPELKRITDAAQASGHPVSVGIPPPHEWKDMELPNTTAYNYSATIGKKNCTQLAMGICKLRSMQGGPSKYQVIMTQNRVPLDLMKLPYAEVETADFSKVTSHTILSQEFDTPEEAIAYFNQVRPLAEDGSMFSYMENTPAPPLIVPKERVLPSTLSDIKRVFRRPIQRTLKPFEQKRGTIVAKAEVDNAKMLPHILKDVLRLNHAQVSIQNQGTTRCSPTKDGEQGVETFSNELVSQLPENTYGGELERRNIVNNVLSTFTANTFAHEINILSESEEVSPRLVEDKDLKDLQNIPPGTTASSYSAQVNPDYCVSVAMGVCALSPLNAKGLPDMTRTRYSVMTIQNSIPTSSMQQEQVHGALNIAGIKSKTVISHHTFDTIGEALEYLNHAKPFAENGSLFEDVGLAALEAPTVQYRAPQAVIDSMTEGRGDPMYVKSLGGLTLAEDTLSNLKQRPIQVRIGEKTDVYEPNRDEDLAEQELQEFGELLVGELLDPAYGDNDQTRQAILNNLLSGFDRAIIEQECDKNKQKPGGENLEYTLGGSYWSASIDTQYGAQVMRYVIKETSKDDSSEQFAVVTLKNRIPLDIMKLGPQDGEAMKAIPGVESHVVWSQAFATEKDAQAYMAATQAVAEDDSFVANLQTSLSLKVEDRGAKSMQELLLAEERTEASQPEDGGGFEVPSYILDDVRRRDHIGILFEEEALEQCTSKRQRPGGTSEESTQWENEQDTSFKEFTGKILTKLKDDPAATYGTPQEQQNILQNVYSVFGQRTLMGETNRMIKDSIQKVFPTVAVTQLNGELLSTLSNNQVPKEVTTRASYAKIDSEFCTQTTLGIFKVEQCFENGVPNDETTKYQVIIAQNRAPLEIMKKSCDELQRMTKAEQNSLESKTALSKLFNTPQEALAYYNQMESLAAEGKLNLETTAPPPVPPPIVPQEQIGPTTLADVKRASQPPVDRGPTAMKDILAPGDIIIDVEVGDIKMPSYIIKDFRRNDMQVSVQDQAPLNYNRMQDTGAFANQLLLQLPESYGNEVQKANIVTNVFSTVAQAGFNDQTVLLTQEGQRHVEQVTENKKLPNGKPGIDASFYSNQVNPKSCVCLAMTMFTVAPFKADGSIDTNQAKYQVVSMQNQAPLSVMQKSRGELAADQNLAGLKGKLVLSKEFDTAEEALDYFNKAKPFVEDGTLFE